MHTGGVLKLLSWFTRSGLVDKTQMLGAWHRYDCIMVLRSSVVYAL